MLGQISVLIQTPRIIPGLLLALINVACFLRKMLTCFRQTLCNHSNERRFYSLSLTCFQMCNLTKRYPKIDFGVALLNLHFEDWENTCANASRLNQAVGFWRTEAVAEYVRTELRYSNFRLNNPPCY